MLDNTGTVSFVLYGILIVITIIALAIAIGLIKSDSIPSDKLEKIIELFKYAIVSTAIATVTLVISDMFKEREQDVKELEYFDKYASDVKKADGITERLQLTKYLSIVAPTGPLKTSWQQYYDTVRIEYAEYLREKKEAAKLDTITNLTPAEQVRKEEVNKNISLKEAPLIGYSVQAGKIDIESAESFEAEGFQQLIAKNVNAAINAFTASENAYNGYHMVYDISKYLRQNRAKLSNPASAFWNNAYNEILKKYAYKMPADVKEQLR